MGKHMLANDHIPKLHKLAESEVTELTCLMVGETALPILERQGSSGITIVSVPRKMIFDILLKSYCPK
jgi:hypothetical protein